MGAGSTQCLEDAAKDQNVTGAVAYTKALDAMSMSNSTFVSTVKAIIQCPVSD